MQNARIERYKEKYMYHMAQARMHETEASAVLEVYDGRPLAAVRYRIKNALASEHYKQAHFYAVHICRMLRKQDQEGGSEE